MLLEGNHALLKKLYWIKLNPFNMVRYDPWKLTVPPGLHPELRDGYYACCRHKRVQQFMQVTQANVTGKTDFMNQPRRQRIMTDAFSALATAVDGTHLAMEDVFIFFNPSHKDWRRALDRCVPFLASEVKQELEMLGGFKRVGDLWQQVESSVNSLRALLGPCMKQMLSSTGHEPSFDWNEAVQRGGYVIVDAHQEFAGTAENVALASLMALDLGETMLNTSKHKRRSFTLIVDEAARFLGPGPGIRPVAPDHAQIRDAVCPGVPGCRQHEAGRTRPRATILGQCGTIICFRSRWHQDNEILVRLLMTGNLKFVPLMHDVYQQRGEYEWHKVQETSRTDSESKNKSKTTGITDTEGWSRGTTRGDSDQRSDTQGKAEGFIYGVNGLITSMSNTKNKSDGLAKGHSSGSSEGNSGSRGTSENETDGETKGWAATVSNKLVPLPIIFHTLQKTGSLEESIADQFEQHRQLLHGLEDRHAIVLAPGMKKAIEIVTINVPDPFQSPLSQASAVKWIGNAICEAHDFYFVPSFDPADQDERVQRFVEGPPEQEQTVGHAPEASEPKVKATRERKHIVDAPAGKKQPFEE